MAARPLVQTLEPRQLLAAFSASFNFQPRGTTLEGWVSDRGVAFGEQETPQGKLTFGWNADNQWFMQDRRTEAKYRYDTLGFMGATGGASTWEVQVPNGLYRVKAMSGDAKYTNSRYHVVAEGSTLYNRQPNKATRWHKGEGLIWVSDGRLTLTSGTSAINNKINSLEVRQVDPHATAVDDVTPASNPFSLQSIVQNEVPAGDAIPMLKALGIKNVKLWYEVKNWDDPVSKWDINNLAKFKAAGFSVTVTFHQREVPASAAQVKGFFERVAAYPKALDVIDFWQIGNEPNLVDFWTGTAQQFVDLQLKPAYEVLQPLGEPVVGGGVTYWVSYCQELMNAGYANYVDYAGFHPYERSGAQVIEVARQAKAVFGDLPLFVSEWNVVWSEWDPEGYAREIDIAAQGLRDISYLNFYFALRVSPTHVGMAGAYKTDNTPNNLYYDVIEGWGA
jgi:hypothetical protein